MKNKILRKLTSRKWWIGFSGAVGGLVTIFTSSGTAAKVSGALLALGSVVGYVLAEGLIDAAKKGVDDEDKRD